ncbi:MAG: formylglycine-generating enzyme family protein [Ardenticatenaceae bacterium]
MSRQELPNRRVEDNPAPPGKEEESDFYVLLLRGLLVVLSLFAVFYILVTQFMDRQEMPSLVLGSNPTTTATPNPTNTVAPLASGSATPSVIVRATEDPNSTPIPTAVPIPTSTRIPTYTRTPVSDLSEKDDMTMVFVPAGQFLMGAAADDLDAEEHEKPQRAIYLDPFWIDQTEVTNAMFDRFIVATRYQTDAEKVNLSAIFNLQTNEWQEVPGAYWKNPLGPGSTVEDDHPVVQVSWNDAVAYCNWANRRLPTEAEWEKAARGPNGRRYPWDNSPLENDLLNSADQNIGTEWATQSLDDGYQLTAPVGTYPKGASPYGVLDMAGNVWEWVADVYDQTYYKEGPTENPTGPADGDQRVRRGGSWRNTQKLLRTTYRIFNTDWSRSDQVGFRCARSAN